jgi:hypothetical protein
VFGDKDSVVVPPGHLNGSTLNTGAIGTNILSQEICVFRPTSICLIFFPKNGKKTTDEITIPTATKIENYATY